MNNLIAKRIHITGVVQGVGFRPFVYNLATRLGLTGWVRNTSGGVDIQVEGDHSTSAPLLPVYTMKNRRLQASMK